MLVDQMLVKGSGNLLEMSKLTQTQTHGHSKMKSLTICETEKIVHNLKV